MTTVYKAIRKRNSKFYSTNASFCPTTHPAVLEYRRNITTVPKIANSKLFVATNLIELQYCVEWYCSADLGTVYVVGGVFTGELFYIRRRLGVIGGADFETQYIEEYWEDVLLKPPLTACLYTQEIPVVPNFTPLQMFGPYLDVRYLLRTNRPILEVPWS